jgi:release factor glutamine methyltransferase
MSLAIASLITRGVAALDPVVDSARADAYLLLARALNCDRAWLLAHGEVLVAPAQAAEFDALCGARATGMPIAYVLGSAGFYGREFAVDARVLVPRPETEHLVDEVLAFVRSRSDLERIDVLDVGTGSGAIACTIAAECSRAVVDGTDASASAIDVARRNALALGVGERCRFHCGRNVEPVARHSFDVVVANLPYVPSEEIPDSGDALAFEPRAALDGGPDGLDAYRSLLPALPAVLKPDGLALLEAGPAQMPGLVALVNRAIPQAATDIGRDYAGRERYVRIVRNSVR